MELTVLPPDLQLMVEKRLAAGGYASVEDVLRRALQIQELDEAEAQEDLAAQMAHIEEGLQQAERGESIPGKQAWRDIQEMKRKWLEERQGK